MTGASSGEETYVESGISTRRTIYVGGCLALVALAATAAWLNGRSYRFDGVAVQRWSALSILALVTAGCAAVALVHTRGQARPAPLLLAGAALALALVDSLLQ